MILEWQWTERITLESSFAKLSHRTARTSDTVKLTEMEIYGKRRKIKSNLFEIT